MVFIRIHGSLLQPFHVKPNQIQKLTHQPPNLLPLLLPDERNSSLISSDLSSINLFSYSKPLGQISGGMWYTKATRNPQLQIREGRTDKKHPTSFINTGWKGNLQNNTQPMHNKRKWILCTGSNVLPSACEPCSV